MADKINQYFEDKFKFVTLFVALGYFLKNYIPALIEGGRWDLYQQIAMSDRFLAGKGLYYSTIEASSPYFPGVSFLATFISKFAYPYRDYILLFIASLIGTLFALMLVKLAVNFGCKKQIALIVVFGLLYWGFNEYRGYMHEFKADSLVLLCGIGICYLQEQIEQKKNIRHAYILAGIFILGLVMDITKQQAVYVNIALILYTIFCMATSWNAKSMIMAALAGAGCVALGIIFSIPDMEIIAIENLKDMPYHFPNDIIWSMAGDFRGHKLFFLLLFYFIFLVFSGKTKLNMLQKKWFLISIVFGAAQIAGGWKTGGNAGNYEAGMVCFLPFVALAANNIFEQIISTSKKGFMVVLGGIFIILLSLVNIGKVMIIDVPRKLIPTMNENRIVSEYLSQHCEGETIMYYSNQYMQIIRSSAVPGMDIYTVPSNIERYWDTRTEALKEKRYKYLYVNQENFKYWDEASIKYFQYNPDSYKALMDNYEAVQDDEMPDSLKGQLFIAR